MYKYLAAAAALPALLVAGRCQPIPQDKAVRTGVLANGFTYFIRHNPEPAERVQLYLVCKVGSVLEEDDQQGLAHFMEHMNFNGTRHFPKNDLVSYLQKAGVQFGADLNAYTGFDETVYQLPLPASDPALLRNGLLIMRDWAQDATLDSLEIEKERGIILEEERLRKNAAARMAAKTIPVMVNHSRYAQRMPIGKDSILLHFNRATLQRFQSNWYRPDLQALIIVGDVDVNEMEAQVKALFSTLRMPSRKRKRVNYTIPLKGHQQFVAVTDEEAPSTELTLLFKHRAPELRTEKDYRKSMVTQLFNRMLNNRRYAELSRERTPAYLNVSMGIQPVMSGVDAFSVAVTAKDSLLARACEQAWTVVARIQQHGFTEGELTRAKQSFLRGMETAVKEKDKTPSVNLVKEYQQLFLHGEAAPGIEWEYAFVQQHLAGITANDIREVAREYLSAANRDIIVEAPEKQKHLLPEEKQVLAWLAAVDTTRLTPFTEEAAGNTLLSTLPQAGNVIAEDSIPTLGITSLTLSNGVKVVLKPTTFKNDEILFQAFAPGGTSLYNDEDYDAAASADKLVSSFGLAGYTPVQLTAVLNNKVAGAAPYISTRSQGISGACSVADLETALALAYLRFTAPRRDSVLFATTVSRSRAVLAQRYAQPVNVFSDTISHVLGAYSYRTAPPTLEKLEKITLDKVMQVYKERFADAAAFTFVFTGSFEIKAMRLLLEQYLGALPSLYKQEEARDLHQHIPSGRMVKHVFTGTENKATVRLVVSGDYTCNAVNNLQLSALGEILQIKLLQQLREQAGEVYSPSVKTSYNKYPMGRFAVMVDFGCAPANVQHLVGMVEKEMQALQQNGPEQEDIDKFKAGYSKKVELALKSNNFWLSYLCAQYEKKEDAAEITRYGHYLPLLTRASLKEAAGVFLNRKTRTHSRKLSLSSPGGWIHSNHCFPEWLQAEDLNRAAALQIFFLHNYLIYSKINHQAVVYVNNLCKPYQFVQGKRPVIFYLSLEGVKMYS